MKVAMEYRPEQAGFECVYGYKDIDVLNELGKFIDDIVALFHERDCIHDEWKE